MRTIASLVLCLATLSQIIEGCQHPRRCGFGGCCVQITEDHSECQWQGFRCKQPPQMPRETPEMNSRRRQSNPRRAPTQNRNYNQSPQYQQPYDQMDSPSRYEKPRKPQNFQKVSSEYWESNNESSVHESHHSSHHKFSKSFGGGQMVENAQKNKADKNIEINSQDQPKNKDTRRNKPKKNLSNDDGKFGTITSENWESNSEKNVHESHSESHNKSSKVFGGALKKTKLVPPNSAKGNVDNAGNSDDVNNEGNANKTGNAYNSSDADKAGDSDNAGNAKRNPGNRKGNRGEGSGNAGDVKDNSDNRKGNRGNRNGNRGDGNGNADDVKDDSDNRKYNRGNENGNRGNGNGNRGNGSDNRGDENGNRCDENCSRGNGNGNRGNINGNADDVKSNSDNGKGNVGNKNRKEQFNRSKPETSTPTFKPMTSSTTNPKSEKDNSKMWGKETEASVHDASFKIREIMSGSGKLGNREWQKSNPSSNTRRPQYQTQNPNGYDQDSTPEANKPMPMPTTERINSENSRKDFEDDSNYDSNSNSQSRNTNNGQNQQFGTSADNNQRFKKSNPQNENTRPKQDMRRPWNRRRNKGQPNSWAPNPNAESTEVREDSEDDFNSNSWKRKSNEGQNQQFETSDDTPRFKQPNQQNENVMPQQEYPQQDGRSWNERRANKFPKTWVPNPNVKPGFCPHQGDEIYKNCVQRCNDDTQCPYSQKCCCQYCVDPYFD